MELAKFDDKVFNIYLWLNGKQVPVALKQCFCSDMVERFIVYGKKQTITIQNNRPELRRLNKPSHKFQWKMIVGPLDIPMDFLKSLFDALENHIENVLEKGYENRQWYISKKK